MKKTKLEIIESVLERVRLRGRCTIEGTNELIVDTPLYIGENNMRCAVGMFLDEDKFDPEMEHVSVCEIPSAFDIEIDDILREDYHGHELEFWERLQVLHDAPSNWINTADTPSGEDLSKLGKVLVEEIKESFGIRTAFREGVSNGA